MATLKYKVTQKTRFMVQIALFTAIIFLLGFTPLGFLKIGVVEITFLVIPVAVGAIMLGPLGGAILGGMFGLVSFIQCFGYSAFGTFLFGLNPFFAFILCVIPRILTGWLTGLIFRLLSSKIKKGGNTIPCVIASLVCPLLNTLFFVGFFVIMFGSSADVLKLFGTTNVWGIIVGLITVNALIEAGVAFVIGSAIAKALSHFLPKVTEKVKKTETGNGDNESDESNGK